MAHVPQSRSVQTLSTEVFEQFTVFAHPSVHPPATVGQVIHDKLPLPSYFGTVENPHAGKLVGIFDSGSKLAVFPVMKYAMNPWK